MPNLTISLDDETHRLAKIHAATHGISLSQMFRDHIRALAAPREPHSARKQGVDRKAVLARYAAFEISARDAMELLGMDCLEDLLLECVRVGHSLPRADDATALAMAQRFLQGVGGADALRPEGAA